MQLCKLHLLMLVTFVNIYMFRTVKNNNIRCFPLFYD